MTIVCTTSKEESNKLGAKMFLDLFDRPEIGMICILSEEESI